MTPHPEAVLDFRILPQPQLCRAVREGISDFARAHNVSEDDLGVFLSALGEALANAIEHARATAPIEISCRVSGDRITATVQDGGVGFEANGEPNTDLPETSAERGRGFAIMRRCSDIFAVRTVPGEGTAVLVGRYLRKLGALGLA
ncbi:MAG TPA: ATP-binding protein [Candidatus Baltobacteraceae bacterium]|nr:ATP-binding protein [Candidatus Baltobacteraceae bacterium]